MTNDKIQFTKEKETMLMTLSGRAIQSRWKNPILRDPWAEEAMRHIDYDLSKQLTGVASWSIWKDIGPTIIATRAATFDQLTTRYLADHPDETGTLFVTDFATGKWVRPESALFVPVVVNQSTGESDYHAFLDKAAASAAAAEAHTTPVDWAAVRRNARS